VPLAARTGLREIDAVLGALHAAGTRLLPAQQMGAPAHAQRTAEPAAQPCQAQDRFLAMLGHELRNPLAPISTAAQLLLLQTPDAARVRYASEVISRQVEHMNSLLGELLDVSRVTRGLVSLQLEPVSLRTVIDRALEQNSGLIAQKQQHFAMDFPGTPLMVKGDKTRLIQIFANLINNATRYTPPRGRIWVAARRAAGQVVVTVDDNGEGFSDQLLPHIFDLFTQGERAPDRAQGGLGLGLALVHSLVGLHGGRVSAFSAGPGQGCNITLTLPSASPAAAEAAGTDGAAPPARLSIMIVDDNIDGAISLSLFLEEAGGHRVSTYYDAGSALANAAAEVPDVFILDIGLPDITGYELVGRLRALPPCAHALFIALTGYGQEQDREQALAAGFDIHLAKPADPLAILGMLDKAIAPH
jgi:signal transduction histidine kinase